MAVNDFIGLSAKNFMKYYLALWVLVISQVSQAAEPLSSNDVNKWMETRIATHKLQNRFRAEADQYDDVVVAFFKARDRYLQQVGYTRARFEEHEQRIAEAHDYILNRSDAIAEKSRRDADLAEAQSAPDPALDPETQEMIAMMRQVGTSEAEIQKMLDAMRQVPDVIAQSNAMMDKVDDQLAARVAPDIPAVEPWLEELDALYSWLAGNRPNPPSL